MLEDVLQIEQSAQCNQAKPDRNHDLAEIGHIARDLQGRFFQRRAEQPNFQEGNIFLQHQRVRRDETVHHHHPREEVGTLDRWGKDVLLFKLQRRYFPKVRVRIRIDEVVQQVQRNDKRGDDQPKLYQLRNFALDHEMCDDRLCQVRDGDAERRQRRDDQRVGRRIFQQKHDEDQCRRAEEDITLDQCAECQLRGRSAEQRRDQQRVGRIAGHGLHKIPDQENTQRAGQCGHEHRREKHVAFDKKRDQTHPRADNDQHKGMHRALVIIFVVLRPEAEAPELGVGVEKDVVEVKDRLVEDRGEQEIDGEEERGDEQSTQVCIHELIQAGLPDIRPTQGTQRPKRCGDRQHCPDKREGQSPVCWQIRHSWKHVREAARHSDKRDEEGCHCRKEDCGKNHIHWL